MCNNKESLKKKLPYPLRNNRYECYPYGSYRQNNVRYLKNKRYQDKIRVIRRPKRKINPIKALFKLIVTFSFLAFVGYFVMPYIYENFVSPMFINRYANKALEFKAEKYYAPTLNYLSNTNIFGQNVISPPRSKNKIMIPLTSTGKNYALEGSLLALSKKYPKMHPSIYVYDYVTGNTAEINSDEVFPSASIIKIPILFTLFRTSEALDKQGDKPISVNESMFYDKIHQTSGSGQIQYAPLNKNYTIKTLANLMITTSDNSATNMLLDRVGGMNQVNAAIRSWGFSKTQMSSWLPDLEGTNTITAHDVSTMLYNLDNPKFLNSESKEYIKYFMSNVRNTKLLKAGLPADALLLHKTGDIGTMLGDAGIVYTPGGKKYIVAILVKRPFNDYSARDFIQEASRIIYNNLAVSAY